MPAGASGRVGVSAPVGASVPVRYAFPDLEAGQYSVLAFMDLDGDGSLDFDPVEPFGWVADEAAGPAAALTLGSPGATSADIVLRKPRHFPAEDRRTDHGALRRLKALPVLQLHGTAAPAMCRARVCPGHPLLRR